MTSRRVIFPPADYWTQPKETAMNHNSEPIPVAPEKVGVVVASLEDGDLIIGIRADCPPPLGRIDLWLGYESACKVARDLTEALALDHVQRAALQARIDREGR